MGNSIAHDQLISGLKKNLKRVEKLTQGPDVRPADFATRDRFARQLYEASKQA